MFTPQHTGNIWVANPSLSVWVHNKSHPQKLLETRVSISDTCFCPLTTLNDDQIQSNRIDPVVQISSFE